MYQHLTTPTRTSESGREGSEPSVIREIVRVAPEVGFLPDSLVHFSTEFNMASSAPATTAPASGLSTFISSHRRALLLTAAVAASAAGAYYLSTAASSSSSSGSIEGEKKKKKKSKKSKGGNAAKAGDAAGAAASESDKSAAAAGAGAVAGEKSSDAEPDAGEYKIVRCVELRRSYCSSRGLKSGGRWIAGEGEGELDGLLRLALAVSYCSSRRGRGRI